MDNLEALILSAEDHKEQDRLITLLDSAGRIQRVYVSRARSGKSHLAALTSPFVYGRFELQKNTTGGYSLRDIESVECFMGLQSSLKGYALACYLAELTLSVLRCDTEPAMLPFLLNTLHFIAENKRPIPLLKGIFEWRVSMMSGYAPTLEDCPCCEESSLLFSVEQGRLFCENCRGTATCIQLAPPVLEAIRRSCESDNPFSFRLSGDSLAQFASISEMFLRYHLDAKLPTLDYYHAIL